MLKTARLCALPILALALAAPPAFARTALLPEGDYDCAAFMPMFIAAGKLQIEGERYRGPSLDGNYSQGWIDFESDAAGNVFLIGKPFGGFTGDGYSITGAQAFINSEGGNTLRVDILTPTGGTPYIDCTYRP